MRIAVEYKNANGIISDLEFFISKSAMCKHIVTVGLGNEITPKKWIRSLAFQVINHDYLKRRAYYGNNSFSRPPVFYDMSQITQFSKSVGLGIADFLLKKIDKCKYTIFYESVMKWHGLPIKGERPDLMGYTQSDKQIAVEAKGFTDSPGDMDTHKIQSQSGPLKVNYSIACISYNLYKGVKCKYYDPIIGDYPFDDKGLQHLSKEYYKGFQKFLDIEYLNKEIIERGNEKFYIIDLSKLFVEYITETSLKATVEQFTSRYSPKIIIPFKIDDYIENGISWKFQPY